MNIQVLIQIISLPKIRFRYFLMIPFKIKTKYINFEKKLFFLMQLKANYLEEILLLKLFEQKTLTLSQNSIQWSCHKI